MFETTIKGIDFELNIGYDNLSDSEKSGLEVQFKTVLKLLLEKHNWWFNREVIDITQIETILPDNFIQGAGIYIDEARYNEFLYKIDNGVKKLFVERVQPRMKLHYSKMIDETDFDSLPESFRHYIEMELALKIVYKYTNSNDLYTLITNKRNEAKDECMNADVRMKKLYNMPDGKLTMSRNSNV
jgi:hypothetical protein